MGLVCLCEAMGAAHLLQHIGLTGCQAKLGHRLIGRGPELELKRLRETRVDVCGGGACVLALDCLMLARMRARGPSLAFLSCLSGRYLSWGCVFQPARTRSSSKWWMAWDGGHGTSACGSWKDLRVRERMGYRLYSFTWAYSRSVLIQLWSLARCGRVDWRCKQSGSVGEILTT